MGKGWVGYADLAGFWNQYENMMEFTFGQFGPKNTGKMETIIMDLVSHLKTLAKQESWELNLL